ncbi:Twin-arginine translocation protein TatB [hydrothermal vent metagenome]|uniref:Twin-arginine translocation protein TatB n=1 Tax=hydrothermal vent metagenome TaxID=652676 RepID=A0A3B0WC04_9ZZZZ
MFDIGFLEILLILIIALLVIGPERMPEVARKIGRFTGKVRRFVHSVKQDGQVQETLKDFKESVNFEEQQQQINQISNQLQSGLDFNQDLKLDELQRPSFGQDTQTENTNRSQFNQAPTEPDIKRAQQTTKIPDSTATSKPDSTPETPSDTNKS